MSWWKDYPWRMIQTNLREIDMEDIRAERFVDDILDFKANVVLLNAAGIISNYTTDLPFHYQSPYLKSDSLKEIVDLCHKNNIRVLARMDFSKVRYEIYEKNPDWAFRTIDGDIMNYNGYVQVCINGKYQQDYAFKIIKETFDKIAFDGLFCNMGGFQNRDYDFKDYGFCHCNSCKRKFSEMYNEELPKEADFNNPVYGKYLRFQENVLKTYRKKVVDYIKGISKEICFDDEEYGRIEASTEYNRKLPHFPYLASSNCRAIIGDGSSNIICSNTSVEFIGYALRHVSVSPALQELRLWQNLTNLGALDYYIMGRIDKHLDRSSFQRIKKVFHFHEKNQQSYMGLKNKAQVLLKRTHRWESSPEEKGWIRTLTECHIPFAEIIPSEFMQADLSKYKLLILADIKNFTEDEAKKVDEYVRNGGRVVATGETGLYDPYVGFRGNQILECLGVNSVKEIRNDMISSMFLLSKKDKKVFTSYVDTEVIAVGDKMVFVESNEDTKKYFKLIPPHMYGPPEKAYFTETTDTPGVTKYSYGRGKSIYIPFLPGAFYNKGGHSNTFHFMKDILTNMCQIKSIGEDVNPMVEISLSEKENGDLFVQFVNNSGCFSLSFFDPIPIYNSKVSIESNNKPKSAISIRTGNSIELKYEDSIIYMVLDKLEDYDAIMIEF